MAMTAQEALDMLRRYPAEIRIQILNHSKANDVVRLFANSKTEEDRKMILVAQNLRFRKICLINELVDRMPKEDWVTVFINSIKFLKKNCNRHGNCIRFGNGAAVENISRFLNWYIQTRYGRPRTTTIEVNLILDIPVLDKPALRGLQNNSMAYATTCQKGHHELLEMSGDLENSAFFYDSQTESIYFTSFQEETLVYKKRLTKNRPERVLLRTAMTGKFYIAVDGHHFHMVCHHGVELCMVYGDLKSRKILEKTISWEPGMLQNIHAFGTHLVLEGRDSVLIMQCCLKGKTIEKIEVGTRPSLLLNPHTFVYQAIEGTSMTMRILSKSPRGITITTIPIEALRINRHSNQILGVLTHNAQRMYLIEDGREPALLYSTRLEREPVEYYE
ncbi:unnamed protein product [Bursaphelenchus xylophilus]|uniref:(pine wood nematode) hypothetical protein n=1 Tax=Bursaphelenchus xylophilus TaxID=6326 RepID=A0A1I7SRK5_BURXY|nr:unnamed protein product [Bursaphelenchus xylophilus]CAG9102243.1 unnamed protein product [Bursaphelenchus xylophilus]